MIRNIIYYLSLLVLAVSGAAAILLGLILFMGFGFLGEAINIPAFALLSAVIVAELVRRMRLDHKNFVISFTVGLVLAALFLYQNSPDLLTLLRPEGQQLLITAGAIMVTSAIILRAILDVLTGGLKNLVGSILTTLLAFVLMLAPLGAASLLQPADASVGSILILVLPVLLHIAAFFSGLYLTGSSHGIEKLFLILLLLSVIGNILLYAFFFFAWVGNL